MANKKGKTETEKRYPVNVDKDIRKFWKASVRWGDCGKMMEYVGASYATIYTALRYGYVNPRNPEWTLKITEFFIERSKNEKEATSKLLNKVAKN